MTIEELVGTTTKVLDDGFVRVVDYMGSDAAIVQAARISYGIGTKQTHEDRGLIRYLMRHRHTTPFEMCEIKFHVRVPMDCWRQWIRHRTANVNEYSTRYSEAIDACQRTAPDKWRRQSSLNKQGSDDTFINSPYLTEREAELHQLARDVYKERLANGVAREQARKDLPLSTYTEAYWKIDLHNLLHFLSLRLDLHAQEEIRAYATAIGEIVAVWCPLTWEAFNDYRLNMMSLSYQEIELIKLLISRDDNAAHEYLHRLGWLEEGKRNRERDECLSKLARLGIMLPGTELT